MAYIIENRVDPDEMLHMQHLTWVYTACQHHGSREMKQ